MEQYGEKGMNKIQIQNYWGNIHTDQILGEAYYLMLSE